MKGSRSRSEISHSMKFLGAKKGGSFLLLTHRPALQVWHTSKTHPALQVCHTLLTQNGYNNSQSCFAPTGREMLFLFMMLPTCCPYGALMSFLSTWILVIGYSLLNRRISLLLTSLFVVPYSKRSKICLLTDPMLSALCPMLRHRAALQV